MTKLKSKVKEILNNVGIGSTNSDGGTAVAESNNENLSYKISNKSKNADKLKLHRDFLKSIESDENNRLTLIESKSSQMVGQSGLIFALMGLFIPLIIDKIDGFYPKLFIVIPLGFAFLFYLLTIHNAAKNLDIKKYRYSRSMAINVIEHKDGTEEDFLIEEINDLLYSTKQNSLINDDKGTNLIRSYYAFRIANILTAVIGVLLCFFILISNSNVKKDEKNNEPEKTKVVSLIIGFSKSPDSK